jgi:hypothetical protein
MIVKPEVSESIDPKRGEGRRNSGWQSGEVLIPTLLYFDQDQQHLHL